MIQGEVNPIYRLHAQCRLTQGPVRSVIIDLDRRNYETIPNGMYHLLMQLQEKYPSRWSSILEAYEPKDVTVLEQYKNWLLRREYIHEVMDGTINNWASLRMDSESACELEDGIIDLSKDGIFLLMAVIRQFETVGCKSLQIRDFDGNRLKELRVTLADMEQSIICNIHLLLRASSSAMSLASEFSNNAHVSTILYHGCDMEQIKTISELGIDNVFGTMRIVEDENCCGIITADSFTVNHQFQSASGRANTCLNRKLSIDRFGNVKNCPSMKAIWGKVEQTSILDVISNQDFRSYWKISKDEIGTCKICEFRDVCSDCRAFLSNPNDLYSKPAKCKYNPNSATWQM